METAPLVLMGPMALKDPQHVPKTELRKSLEIVLLVLTGLTDFTGPKHSPTELRKSLEIVLLALTGLTDPQGP